MFLLIFVLFLVISFGDFLSSCEEGQAKFARIVVLSATVIAVVANIIAVCVFSDEVCDNSTEEITEVEQSRNEIETLKVDGTVYITIDGSSTIKVEVAEESTEEHAEQ